MAPCKPETCIGCPLYDAPGGPVWGDGPPNAPILLLGEAPGEEEASVLKPFVGGSGRVLNAMLKQVSLSRDTCFVTNVVKCRPVTKSGKNRTPTEEEIRHCARHLVQELQNVKPNIVIALGAIPLYVLRGTADIGKRRGVPFEAAGQKVLATFHPAFVMRQQDYFPVVLWDLQRAVAESKNPVLLRAEVSYNLDADPTDTDIVARARRSGFVTTDIETTDLDPARSQVICIGFGAQSHQAEVFRWTPGAARLTQVLFDSPDIELVGQNSENFDIPFLEAKGVKRNGGRNFDTMLAFHLTNSSLPKDLGFIASFFTDQEYWKDDSGKDLFLYNARDVDNTTRAYLGLKAELQALGMTDLFYKSVMPLQPVLRRMSAGGIRKDEAKAHAWSKAILIKAAERERELKAAMGQDINIHSSKQLMHLLYDVMNLPVQYVKDKNRGMRPTANAEALDNLAKLTDNPIFKQIYEIRQARHQVSTYLEVATDEKGFVHPRFGTAKATTGRINSWEPNAQNIPAQLREVYIPDTPEHIFIEADWSQIEWRLQVVLSGDPVGLELLASGKDNHRAVASEILRKPYESVTEDERYKAKFVVHGLGYGRGAASIAKQYGIPIPEVERFIHGFQTRFRVFWAWRDRLVGFVRANNYLANPFGRRRWWYTQQVTEIYNFLAQSTGADMMYLLLLALSDAVDRLALTVHDSVLISVPKDNVKVTVEAVRDLMHRTWPQISEASANPQLVRSFYPNGFICPADFTLGNTWRECKDKKAQPALRAKYGVN